MPGFLIGGQPSSNSGLNQDAPLPVEVARSHRWTIRVLNDQYWSGNFRDSLSFYALSVTRPSTEIDKITMHHRSTEIYLPGKYRPSTVDIAFYEVVTSSDTLITTDAIRKWWDGIVYNTKEHSLNMKSWKVDLECVMENGLGETVRTYHMSGVFPIKVAPSNLDYSVTDLSTVSVTLSIDGFWEE